jgi:transcriptional regulator with XRE-family HTH domain
MNLSQEELAFRAELDRTYISQIERGVGNPSLLVLLKISSVLKVEIVDLFGKQ